MSSGLKLNPANRSPKRLRQKAWDATNPKYASLDHPEWLSRVPREFWQDQQNHKRYMTWLKNKLGIEYMEDWYEISFQDFHNNRGAVLLTHYGGYFNLLKAMFPKYPWQEWKFSSAPSGFWQDRSNRVRYMKWLGKQLGFRKLDDWYAIKNRHLTDNYGGTLLRIFRASPMAIIKDVFPQRDWLDWKFNQVTQGFWDDRQNCLRYMKWLGKKRRYKKLDDWYGVKAVDFRENFGQSLLKRHHMCASRVVTDMFPKHRWQIWRFITVPAGFWNERKNRVSYMNWLGQHLGFRKKEDWYKLKHRDIEENYGGSVVYLFYHGSPYEAVKDCFPDYEWQAWKFTQVPKGFWQDKKNRIKYMDWLGKQLGFRQPEDWYRLKKADFDRNHGVGLLGDFGGSPMAVVKDVFPKRVWYEWKFHQVPKGFWDNRENRIRYLKWLGRQLGFRKLDGWYQVTREDIRNHHGQSLLKRFRKVGAIVRDAFPDHSWSDDRFVS